MNVPLTGAVSLSVTGRGPQLKTLTSSSQTTVPQWRETEGEREAGEEEEEERREKGSPQIILIKRQGSGEVDLPQPPPCEETPH